LERGVPERESVCRVGVESALRRRESWEVAREDDGGRRGESAEADLRCVEDLKVEPSIQRRRSKMVSPVTVESEEELLDVRDATEPSMDVLGVADLVNLEYPGLVIERYIGCPDFLVRCLSEETSKTGRSAMFATFHCWFVDGSRRISVRYVPSSLLLRRMELCTVDLFGSGGRTPSFDGLLGPCAPAAVSICNSFRISSR
jgi:hypothetical protein